MGTSSSRVQNTSPQNSNQKTLWEKIITCCDTFADVLDEVDRDDVDNAVNLIKTINSK